MKGKLATKRRNEKENTNRNQAMEDRAFAKKTNAWRECICKTKGHNAGTISAKKALTKRKYM